jgi:hypothetical protein
MQCKYRPYVAIAVAVYIGIVWSAYRWSINQRLPDGSIFDHIENERKKSWRSRFMPSLFHSLMRNRG